MKKNILAALLAIFCITSLTAKTLGTEELMRKGGIVAVNYSFNFSQMRLDGVMAQTWFARRGDNKKHAKYNAFTGQLAQRFINAANQKSMNHKGYSLNNKTKARYKVIFTFTDVDEDGAHKVTARVVERASGRKVGEKSARARGTDVGGLQSNFLSNADRTGEKIGDKLADDILDDLYE